MGIKETLEENQATAFEQKMAATTLVGNLSNWRNMRDNKRRSKILTGRIKILTLINQFKV